jgi:hypothetical protein
MLLVCQSTDSDNTITTTEQVDPVAANVANTSPAQAKNDSGDEAQGPDPTPLKPSARTAFEGGGQQLDFTGHASDDDLPEEPSGVTFGKPTVPPGKGALRPTADTQRSKAKSGQSADPESLRKDQENPTREVRNAPAIHAVAMTIFSPLVPWRVFYSYSICRYATH